MVGVAGVGLAANLILQHDPALAVTNISLEYGPIQRTLPFSDLQAFADSGKPTGLLSDLLRATKSNPASVQKILTETVPISVVTMDRIVNSYFGEVLLSQLGQVILPVAGQDSLKPLKAALVNGVKDNQITILSVLQSYPVDMRVNGRRFMQIYDQIQQDGRHLPEILSGLQGILPKFFPGLSLGPDSPRSPTTTQPAPAASPEVTPAPPASPSNTPTPVNPATP
jgi:hypothetical protein